uniref:Synapse-associated protein n=1 Tax=Rhizophora mucronata TaxID=61149 RepID=A0A2P2J9P8_RHIMU
MDFFKSVFADETESQRSESDSQSPLNKGHPDPDPTSSSSTKPQNPEPTPDVRSGGGGWNFGGMIKTLTTKSESVIETYRRDLKEFGSGLRKEIEVAQGSIENVGNVIDEIGSSVLENTAQIISHGKDAILSLDHESDSSENNNERKITDRQSLNSKRYSRFDAQVRAIQNDASTYCEEPEDLDDYREWKLEFVLEEKREETESLLEDNGAMAKMYKRVVPVTVDEETFWCRYYYKVDKLQQAEQLRAKLVKRAISRDEEEEDLSWDVEDDDDEEEEEEVNNEIERMRNKKLGSQEDSTRDRKNEEISEVQKMDNEESEHNGKSFKNKMATEESEQTVIMKQEMGSKEEKTTSEGDNVASKKADLDISKGETVTMSDEKASSEGKGDNGESCKDSEFSVVSSHPSMPEEEDLGWDEIEDLSSIDDKKTDHSGSANKADLRKRLSAAEEEEDLSWDIEDDDEPAKA